MIIQVLGSQRVSVRQYDAHPVYDVLYFITQGIF